MKKAVYIILSLLLGLFVSDSFAGEVSLFGPKTYVRTTGQPDEYTDTFSAGFGIPATGKLTVWNGAESGGDRVYNGDESGDDRISSALIFVNGVQIFGPSDFNQGVYLLEAPVDLVESNSIFIELRSNPGSYLTIQITQDIDPPSVSISSEPDAVRIGESSTLTWSSTNAETVTIDQGIGSVDLNGSITISPTEIKTYTVTAENPGGSDSDSVTVTILNSPPVAEPQSVTTNEDDSEPIVLTGSDV
ncbi:MAG: hypothetical protein SV775_01755, partial [Thermodesulfobacteriota bacterium]|nr:hypothetical protein [Thermodesulfobacteriota bacterium]